MLQEGAGFQDFALDLSNPDFVKYAEAYGAKGYRIREVYGLPQLEHRIFCCSQYHCRLCWGFSTLLILITNTK